MRAFGAFLLYEPDSSTHRQLKSSYFLDECFRFWCSVWHMFSMYFLPYYSGGEIVAQE